MSLPAKLKNYNLFNDGQNYIGQVAEIVLPKLTAKMEEWRGAGMDAPIDIDLGMEKLTMEWTIGGIEKQVLTQFGALSHAAYGLRFAGAVQREDSEKVKALEIEVRGRHSEIDFGTAKTGDDTAKKIATSLSYYKLTLDGEVLIEIDVINMVKRIGGKDLLDPVRAALGL
ncbi:phage major tail tube protein [Alcaligenaceae bacterium SJ-26]|nr:phage major tail tube protein [Alcaligenaceae bacterium SJ-26]